ncbi:unnamed protein product [Danaus chrysippus]|uniref:(African queen) hypothetical protein n=1 Tax=Danaus chrysippus TaxID=151541 RepID=A0A8J2MHH3_9NEOP|nr:unnamed protein product [Danaus chrysippus]
MLDSGVARPGCSSQASNGTEEEYFPPPAKRTNRNVKENEFNSAMCSFRCENSPPSHFIEEQIFIPEFKRAIVRIAYCRYG